MSAPAAFRWTGEAFEPLPRFQAACDRDFVVGAVYTLTELGERSSATHRHYFATLSEAWANLPGHLAERFPTPESLRKFALIRAGYRDERSVACSSKAEAQRLAAFIKPLDDFAVVTTAGAVVTVWTAKSQSLRAMGKADFQASKQAVLEVVAEMVGVTPDALSSHARAA